MTSVDFFEPFFVRSMEHTVQYIEQLNHYRYLMVLLSVRHVVDCFT